MPSLQSSPQLQNLVPAGWTYVTGSRAKPGVTMPPRTTPTLNPITLYDYRDRHHRERCLLRIIRKETDWSGSRSIEAVSNSSRTMSRPRRPSARGSRVIAELDMSQPAVSSTVTVTTPVVPNSLGHTTHARSLIWPRISGRLRPEGAPATSHWHLFCSHDGPVPGTPAPALAPHLTTTRTSHHIT